MSIDNPDKDEVKQACELLNALFENYQQHEKLADYAATALSESTIMSLPNVRRAARKSSKLPDFTARIEEQ